MPHNNTIVLVSNDYSILIPTRPIIIINVKNFSV